MSENEDPLQAENNPATILPPDYTLKKMIGENVDIKQVFSEEAVAKAQQTIDKHQDSFKEWAINDVNELNENFKKKDITAIEKISARLKSQAGTFNYELGTLVAKSLNNFCNAHHQPSQDHLLVIRKHIDTLQVIFLQNITGNGGETGKELLDNLFKLVDKYK